MIFGGSSVTAGYDNYYNQSYGKVFERRMKPLFDALNIDLQVNIIAQGANPCRPYNLCYEPMGGSNADWLGWEQSYSCPRSKDIFELIARMAYWNKAVVHFSASGAFVPHDCPATTDPIPWIAEHWTPELANIHDKYMPSQKDVRKLKATLNQWYEDGNSVLRFTEDLGGGYSGVGPHGFSVWGESKSICFNEMTNQSGCVAFDVKGECYSKGGPHWMTKEAAMYGSASGTGAQWNPTWGMHLLRAETMAYNYANILLDAIYTVEEDLESGSASKARQKYQRRLRELQSPIPDSRHCKPECDSMPVCLYYACL
jgi:hypothetical protein